MATKYSAKKRSGIFGYVETFPRFVARIETILSGNGCRSENSNSSLSARPLIDRYYEKISSAIFDSFVQLSSEVEESDEKGHINANVMTIENSHFLFTKFSAMKFDNSTILSSSKSFYESALSSYARFSIYRVLGKYAEYFEGLSNLLKSTAPEEVAFTSTYSKASAKKIIASMPSKEIKKSIDLLHQRVLKHFNTQVALQKIVWIALKDDFLQRERDILANLEKVFPGSVDVKPTHSIEALEKYFTELSK